MFPLVTALVIIIAAVMAVRTLNSPAEGTVTTPVSDTTAGQPKNQPAYKTYSDAVVTFNYPTVYMTQSGDKSSGYKDVVELRKTRQRTEFGSVGVYAGDILTDSGVNLRRTHPELYKSISTDDDSLVYTKQDSTEYTGFIQKGSDVVTVSFNSVGPHDFAADYKLVAGSLQLKQ